VIRVRKVGSELDEELIRFLASKREDTEVSRVSAQLRNGAIVAIVGISAVFLVRSANAQQWIIIDLPWGNSTGSVHPSENSLCFGAPSYYFDWQHSLAYSVENYSSPAKTEYKYLDFYGGSTSPYVSDMKWTQGYLVYGGSNIPLNALNQKSFYSYDITIWLWTYLPHYAYTYTPFAKGGYDVNCASHSQVHFYP